jgi:2-octaprenyl-6-methoxyphenol hydroxylase
MGIAGSPIAYQAWVRGAGPTGCLVALGLAQVGWRVILHDPLQEEQLQSRSRAYALTQSSRNLLTQLQLWDQTRDLCQAFTTLRLCDLSVAKTVCFQQNNQELGWIINHPALMKFLLARCRENPAISLQLGPDSNPKNCSSQCQLTVIAEGGNSSSRKALGIGFYGWPYRQGCLTVQVSLDSNWNDSHTAWELFRPEGPFALLPLGEGKAQLVWSAPLNLCQKRAGLAEPNLLAALAEVLPNKLRAIALLDKPAAFPVEWRLAPKLVMGNQLLCGESAHRCHPVGGQGLNLCWRDVAALLIEARRQRAQGTSLTKMLNRYQQRRWFDLIATLIATDALVRLFSNQNPILRTIRSVVLDLLKASRSLRLISLKLASGDW